jgi:hypothetical protein
MTHPQAKDELVKILDQHAFEPVLRAREDDYPESKHAELRHVKDATERERDRYQHYESAEKVVQMYRDDLSSQAARQIDQELRDLELPTLADCRSLFEREADRLGVR